MGKDAIKVYKILLFVTVSGIPNPKSGEWWSSRVLPTKYVRTVNIDKSAKESIQAAHSNTNIYCALVEGLV